MKEYTKELMEFVLSLRYEDLPPEAVELAKAFGGERSPAYINGMLGTLAKRLEGGEAS